MVSSCSKPELLLFPPLPNIVVLLEASVLAIANRTAGSHAVKYFIGSAMIRTCPYFLLPLLCLAVGWQQSLAQPTSSAQHSPPAPSDVIRTINLEETEEEILTTITHAELSPNGSILAVVDRGSGYLLLYDAGTGKLLKSVVPGPEFTDSLVRQTRSLMKEGIIPLSRADVDTGRYPVDYAHAIFRNHFTSCSFLSDSAIAIYGLIKPALWNSTRRSVIGGLDAAAVFYDIPSGATRLVPIGSDEAFFSRNPTNHYPQSWTFLYDRHRGDFITSTAYIRPNGRLDPDSTRYLARYSTTGRRAEDYLPLPPEIRHADGAHNFQRVSAAISDSGELVAVVDIIPRIYNITRGTSFDITDLSAVNGEFFRMAADGRMTPDSLLGYLRVRVPNIAVTRRNTVIVPIAYIVPQGSVRSEQWHLREYTLEGKLLRSMEIMGARPDAVVRYAGYSTADDALFVASLSKESGWWISLLR